MATIEKDLNALYEAQVKNLEETKRNAQQGTPIQSLSQELKGKRVQSLTVYKEAVVQGEVMFIDPGTGKEEVPVATIVYDYPIYKKDDSGIHEYKIGVFTGECFIDHFQLI